MTESAGELVTTVNGKDVGLAALLTRMEALGKQADDTLTRAGQRIGEAIGAGAGKAAPAVTGLGLAAERAARENISLAQIYARGQAAAGDYGGAVQRLTSALDGNAAADERTIARTNNQIAAYERAAIAAREKAAAEAAAAKAGGGGGGFASQVGGEIGSQLAGIVGPAALAGAAVAAVGKGVELAQVGAQAELVRTRFDQLAKQAGTTGQALIGALRSASGGEISDLNLQLAANRANLLGVATSAEQLSVLMGIARDRAQQLGTSSAKAFDDLVTGLGRGSPLILDNLGITVKVGEANEAYARSLGKAASALTAAEQKQALINAVMAQGKASLDATGGAAESAAGKIDKFNATLDNLKAKAGGALANAVTPTLDLVSSLVNATDGSRASLLAYVDAANTFTGANAGVAATNRNAAASFLDLIGVTDQAASATSQASASDRAFQATRDALAAATAAGKLTMDQYTSAIAQVDQAQMQANNTTGIGTGTYDAYAQAAAAAAEKEKEHERYLQAIGAAGPVAQAGLGQAAAGADAVAQSLSEASGEARVFLALMGAAGVATGQLQQKQQGMAAGNAAAAGKAIFRGFGDAAGAAATSAAVDGALQRALHANAAPDKPKRGGGGGSKLTDAEKEQKALLKAQDDYQTKSQDSAEQYEEEMGKIAEDGERKREQAQREYQQAALDSRAGFYTQLANVKDPKLAQQMSADYEAAVQKAAEIGRTKGADAGQAYLQASQQAIQNQSQLKGDIAQAEKDKDKPKAEYLKGLLKLQQDADNNRLKQVEDAGSAIATAEEKQYSEAQLRYAKHLDTLGETYARKVKDVPGLGATLGGAGGAASIPNPPTAASVSPSASGAAATGAGAGAGSATLVTDPATQAAIDQLAGRIEGKLGELATAVGAVEKRTGDVEKAVNSLKGRSALAA